MLLPPTPETAAAFFGTWKAGAILLSMSVLYGDEGIRHRLTDSRPRCWSPTRPTPTGWSATLVEHVLILDDELLSQRLDRVRAASTPRPTIRRSSTTPRARPGWPRASSTPTATSSPTRSSSTATTSGTASVFHGMGEWAWAAGIAPLLGPWRYGAVQAVYQREGGFDPHKQLDFLSRHEVTNVFGTPTAIRSMMSISDAGTRYPQQFRIVCSAGEPLNPEAIRWFREQYGVTVLDLLRADRVLSAVRQLPVHGGPRGLDGQADAGLGGGDPRRGRASGRARRARRDLPAGAVQPALPARLLEPSRPRTPRRCSAATGSTPRTRPRPTRTATSGTRAAPTT